MVVTMLAGAWGTIVSLPFVFLARRSALRTRVCALAGTPRGARPRRRWAPAAPQPVATVVAVLAAPARRRAARARQMTLRRALPLAVDLLGVAVGAGCTPYGAIEVAAQWCSPAVGYTFDEILRHCHLGASFDDALDDAARREPALAPIADALGAGSRLGVPIGPSLARVAGELRADLRRAAEQRARTVPVRLLFPHVFLVLPAFALLTVAPVLLAGFGHA
jgi:tight adherence protein C